MIKLDSLESNVNIGKTPSMKLDPSTHVRLCENMAIAREIIDYVKTALPHGACNILNAKVTYDEICELRAVEIKRFRVFEEARTKINTLIEGQGIPETIWNVLYVFLRILNETELGIRSNVAKSYKMGNCSEYVNVALDYLKEKGAPRRAEAIADRLNDHIFIVIDRDPNGILNDVTTWGSSALICDPWAKRIIFPERFDQEFTSIFSRHLSPPKTFLEKKEFSVYYRHDDTLVGLFSRYIGKFFFTLACLDLFFNHSFKAYA